jgi:hypothetical protein
LWVLRQASRRFRRLSIRLLILEEGDCFVDIIGCPPGAFHADSQKISKRLKPSHAALPKGQIAPG